MKLLLKVFVYMLIVLVNFQSFAKPPFYEMPKMLRIYNFCDIPITFNLAYKNKLDKKEASTVFGTHTLPAMGNASVIEFILTEYIAKESEQLVIYMVDEQNNKTELPIITKEESTTKKKIFFEAETVQLNSNSCIFDAKATSKEFDNYFRSSDI